MIRNPLVKYRGPEKEDAARLLIEEAEFVKLPGTPDQRERFRVGSHELPVADGPFRPMMENQLRKYDYLEMIRASWCGLVCATIAFGFLFVVVASFMLLFKFA